MIYDASVKFSIYLKPNIYIYMKFAQKNRFCRMETHLTKVMKLGLNNIKPFILVQKNTYLQQLL